MSISLQDIVGLSTSLFSMIAIGLFLYENSFSTQQELKPYEGKYKIKTKFLWFPLYLNKKIKWFSTAVIVYKCEKLPKGFPINYTNLYKYKFVAKNFADEY